MTFRLRIFIASFGDNRPCPKITAVFQTVTATVRGIRTDELDRLKSYHLQSDLISHKERRRRDTGEYEDIRSGHHFIHIIINESEEILDLYEDKEIHPDDLNCKFYVGKIRNGLNAYHYVLLITSLLRNTHNVIPT